MGTKSNIGKTKIMTRKHIYGGYEFNIEVKLNDQIERRINGIRKHKVKIVAMWGPIIYNEFYICESAKLEETINLAIENANAWCDGPMEKSAESILLERLGFN